MTPQRRFLVVLLGCGVAIAIGALFSTQVSRRESHDGPATGFRPTGTSPTNTLHSSAQDEAPIPPSAGQSKSTALVERIRELLDAIEPVLPGEVENATAIELLKWWAETEPIAAIGYAVRHPDRHGRTVLARELYVAWLDRERVPAVEWIGSLAPGELRSQLLPAIISIVATEQPAQALRLADELIGENRNTALAAVFSEWTAQDPRAAAERAMRLPEPAEQNLVLRLVLGRWIEDDPATAIAWAKSLPPQPGPDSLDVLAPVTGILIEKWAAHAPADAAAHVVDLPPGAGRIQLLTTVARQWAGIDPASALTWAAAIQDETDRRIMVRGMAATVVETNPRAAAELALALGPGDAQEQALSLVVNQWTARDHAAFLAWADSIARGPTFSSALPPLIASWAGANLDEAGRWLKRQPAGPSRDAACAAMMQYLAPREPRLAAQWAEEISNSGARARAETSKRNR